MQIALASTLLLSLQVPMVNSLPWDYYQVFILTTLIYDVLSHFTLCYMTYSQSRHLGDWCLFILITELVWEFAVNRTWTRKRLTAGFLCEAHSWQIQQYFPLRKYVVEKEKTAGLWPSQTDVLTYKYLRVRGSSDAINHKVNIPCGNLYLSCF